MLPSLRLLIAAMSATVVMLMCGFGVFAAFRVSHDPIAHLPAAVPPLQLFAEKEAALSPVVAAHEGASLHSQFDVPSGMSGQPVPDIPTAEQHAAAEFAADEMPGAASSSAAKDAEPGADHDAENESAAIVPPVPPVAASPPVGQLAASSQSDSRHGEIEADAASDFALPRPLAPAAEYSTTTDKAIEATAVAPTAPAENAPGSQRTFADAPSGKAFAALNPETEPAAGAHPAARLIPDDTAAGPTERERRPKPSPAAARRSISRGPPAISRDEARRVERPVRTLSAAVAVKPKRPHVAAARTVRAVRFTAPYYAQYARSPELSYGYGQGASADQGEATVVRRVVRLQAARFAARRVNSAIGGPFVRAPSQ
jgi:hypothetical protein